MTRKGANNYGQPITVHFPQANQQTRAQAGELACGLRKATDQSVKMVYAELRYIGRPRAGVTQRRDRTPDSQGEAAENHFVLLHRRRILEPSACRLVRLHRLVRNCAKLLGALYVSHGCSKLPAISLTFN